jgi:hypothetical protein
VSSASQPPADAPAAPPMPPSVRVAVIVMSLLAFLLLLYTALLWIGREGVIDRLVEEGSIAREDGVRFMVTQLSPFVVLGLLLAVSAWFLARRRTWARWMGLTAVVIIGLLTIASVLMGGIVSILTLLLAVLSMAGISSLLARTTKAWLPPRRGPA